MSNYPDPEHATFVDEYDWDYKDEKGLIYKYINHVEGSQRLEKVGRKVNRRTSPKPQSYYLFASVAVYLLNHPEYIRDVRAKGGLHGGFVVNYANSIPVNELLPPEFNDTVEPLVKKLKEKKHILPVTFASLFARVFNFVSFPSFSSSDTSIGAPHVYITYGRSVYLYLYGRSVYSV